MQKSMLRVLSFVLALTSALGAVNLGQYLKICDRNSVDINDCMVESVQEGIVTLSNGIQELEVPSVDPYVQKDLKIKYNNNQLTAKMAMKNVVVEGLKKATVHDARVRADDDRLHIEIDLTAPKVFISGEYEGEGQYNALKIEAHGAFNTTMTNLSWTWKIDGVPEKNDSETFMRITAFEMRPDVENMVSYLSNDNPESRELTELGNGFINGNWRVLYKELLPFAQANWNRIGIKIANKIFLKVPYNQIFPVSV